MKKTLLVAALATGFAGAAHAADSVTLYGILDAGIGYEQVKGNGFKQSHVGASQGVSSGSRFGIRGREDLGGGLKAIFTLEAGINNENGNSAQDGRLFGRQATVGLADDTWGQIEFGRQKNMASKYFDSLDPFGTSYNLANIGSTFGSANSVRPDNMVLYQSPNFSGFSFGVGYSFNVDDHLNGENNNGQNTGFATNDNNRAITAGLRYTNGPLDLVATYDRLNPTHAAEGGQDSARIQQYILGGSYDFEVVKLVAAFSQTRDGWFVGQNLGTTPTGYQKLGNFSLKDGFRANSYMVGFTLPLGASSVLGSWQHADPNNSKLTGGDENTNIYSLGYTYDLSKRTNLYAYASYADNYAFQDNLKDTAVGVGLRHRF